MEKFIRKHKYILILMALCAVTLFINLGKMPLLDPDEPVYAETAREMHEFGDFLSPRIFGEYWYDKPPMYYWLVAAAQSVFGDNEFAARFPAAAMAFITVLLLFIAMKKLAPEKTAFFCALVLLSSIEFFYLAKGAVTDTTLNCFITLSMLGFLTKKYAWWYLGAALAVVTKGPVGVFFPVLIAVIYFICRRDWKELRELEIIKGSLIFIIIAAPWYILMYLKHGFAFLDTFLGFHNIVRFTSAEHPETNKLSFYFIVLLAGFFPWVIMLPQAIIAACKKNTDAVIIQKDDGGGIRTERDVKLFALIWASVVFVFFTISQTKLVSYILPMYPPLAILLGYYLHDIFRLFAKKQYCIWWSVLFVFVLAVNIAVFGYVERINSMWQVFLEMSFVMDAMLIISGYYIYRNSFVKAFYSKVALMIVFAVALSSSFLLPVIGDYSTKNLSEKFSRIYDGRSEVYIVKFLRPGFAYYTGVYGIELSKQDLAGGMLNFNGSYYVVLLEPEYKKYQEIFSNDEYVKVIQDNNKIVLYKKI